MLQRPVVVPPAGRPLLTNTEPILTMMRLKSLCAISSFAGALLLPHLVPSEGFAPTRFQSATTSLPAALTFLAETQDSTGPLPYSSKERVAAFMESPDTRNLFFSAGGKRGIAILDRNEKLDSFWMECCTLFYGDKAHPSDEDSLLACVVEMRFPGMALQNKLVNGMKTTQVDGLTQHEGFLVAENREASGPAPIVWIYNKLTGASKVEKGTMHIPTTFADAKVSASIDEDDQTFEIKLRTRVQVNVEFPNALLKILPLSKEKMEEEGSKSVLQSVAKDMPGTFEVVKDAFMEFEKLADEQSSTTVDVEG